MEGKSGHRGNTLNTSIDINTGLTFDDTLFNCTLDLSQSADIEDGEDHAKEKKETTENELEFISATAVNLKSFNQDTKLRHVDNNDDKSIQEKESEKLCMGIVDEGGQSYIFDAYQKDITRETLQLGTSVSPSKDNILKGSNMNVKIAEEYADHKENKINENFRIINEPSKAAILQTKIKVENEEPKSGQQENNFKSSIPPKRQISKIQESNEDFNINIDRHNVYFKLQNSDNKLPQIDRNNIHEYLTEIEKHHIPKSICVTSSKSGFLDNAIHAQHDDIPLKITKVVPVFVCQSKMKGLSKETSIRLESKSDSQNLVDPQNLTLSSPDTYNRCSKSSKPSQIIKVNVCNFLNNFSDNESKEIWRRRIHCIKERKRGKHINDAFEVLRLHIPWLKRHKRMTSRYKILTGAITYISELKATLGMDLYEPVYVPGIQHMDTEPQREVEIETNTMIKNLNKDANIKVDLIKTAFMESCLQSVIDDEDNRGGVTAIAHGNRKNQQPF